MPTSDHILRSIGRHIVVRLAEAALADLQARYDVGLLAHAVRRDSERRFARGALFHLASILALDVSRLRRYARVTEAISVLEFSDLIQLRDTHGFPLTWSHFERLARLRQPQLRRSIAVEATTAGLSVRRIARPA